MHTRQRRFCLRSVAIAKAVFCALRLSEEDLRSQTPGGGTVGDEGSSDRPSCPSVWCCSSNIAKQTVAG